MVTKESLWIELVKESDDSRALELLVKRYRPMIDNLYLQYYIGGYDRNDWYQEAFLVCYQTCRLYNGESGSKFGSFFKMKFKNHIIDIIRRENAVKRRANLQTDSYDQLMADGLLEEKTVEYSDLLDFSNNMEKFVHDMSKIELFSLQFLLGKISLEDACRKAQCDLVNLKRAARRCKKRFKDK